MLIDRFRQYRSFLLPVSLFLIVLVEIFPLEQLFTSVSFVNALFPLAEAMTLFAGYGIFSYYVPFLHLALGLVVLFLLTRHSSLHYAASSSRRLFVFMHLAFLAALVLFYAVLVSLSLPYFLLLVLFYLLFFGVVISLVLAAYDYRLIRSFIVSHWLQILLSLVISWLFLHFYSYFQHLWPYLSFVVGVAVFYIARLFYADLFISYQSTVDGLLYEGIPTIGTREFGLIIFKPCSGIEGITLFLLLFSIVVLVDWRKLDLGRVALAYVLGLVLAFVVNIIRIFVLLVVGLEVSPAFASGGFHSNLGWILFSAYFFLFQYFIYSWMKKKEH